MTYQNAVYIIWRGKNVCHKGMTIFNIWRGWYVNPTKENPKAFVNPAAGLFHRS